MWKISAALRGPHKTRGFVGRGETVANLMSRANSFLQADFDEKTAVIAQVDPATGPLARTGTVATMTTMACLASIRMRIMISRIWKFGKNVVLNKQPVNW